MTPRLLPLQRPPRLRPGDTVAVVATSGPLAADRLERGVSVLRSWELAVRVGEHALDRDPRFPHLAGSDVDRARDFENAWCDPDVKAVLVGRGGSGAARIIDLIDWPRLRQARPKILLGFSDVTALHQAVARLLGLVTLFGPMPAAEAWAGEQPDRSTLDHVRRTLFEPEAVQTLTPDSVVRVVDGFAEGILAGGTLALLAGSIGTRAYHPATGGIAVLEDVAEPAYRLDMHLTQLERVGWFDGVQGVVLGSWTDCRDGGAALVATRLSGLGVPVLAGLPFGHCVPALTIPLGVAATLDTGRGALSLKEPALA